MPRSPAAEMNRAPHRPLIRIPPPLSQTGRFRGKCQMYEGQPIDVKTHVFAMRLSYELVGIVAACLKPEQIHALATEYYLAIVRQTWEYEQQKRF